ncbi:hypothetical protein K435DRAFT_764819 [Dendrothele bispora CBS 962.96]|uniref:DUF6534 domain-containing protein n=1 Tax=Dendrothele bispora (strain CBS 962.96) TaxID=1314807 RepID=A0A4S8L7R4_DENBC|nr:hypothetical protein K435DRAFT_768214 [Dendrothele bispora CBS 962.96]THU84732.1 hypothetical protein K435DRAFT_764819 [Dendrothele bispora CBS 962.96]
MGESDIVWLTIPRLLGFAWNWGLMGALTVQVYIYHISFPGDRVIFKALVYILYLLEWAQTFSATYDAVHWFGYGWGNNDTLDQIYTEFLNIPIFTSTIGAAVQIFFGWRIFTLSRSKVLFGFIILMALIQLAGAAVTGYYICIVPTESNDIPGLPRSVGVRLGTSAAVDIVIAGCMTYFLLKNRSEFSIQTNAVITKLVRLTIETGTITATAAIIDLVFFLSIHDNTMHQISGVTLSKLYTNSLLMLFNNRMKRGMTLSSTVESSRRTTNGWSNQSPDVESYPVFHAAQSNQPTLISHIGTQNSTLD